MSSFPRKILITSQIPDIGISMLRDAGFALTIWTPGRYMTPGELREGALKHQVLLPISPDKLDASFLRECSHLELISQFAVGYDNIDISEATRLGIPVGNTPGVLSDATADIAFALMMATSRKMFFLHKKILKGEWGQFRPTADLGIELKGKTLGIFGMGNIGFEMAKRCRGAFEMEIIYCSRSPKPLAEELLDAGRVNFDELLERSDVLSVHCSLNGETRGIFDRNAFRRMKRSAVFINTSRGPVHNERDLREALEAGEIWGAGLDVTDPEPMSADHPLLNMENVAILPHVGSGTVEAREGMSRLAAENIIEFYRSGRVPNAVNPEVFRKGTR